MTKRKKQAKILRDFRKIHRYSGISLFVFFFVISITGLLLGWKKDSKELLLPNTYQGTSSSLKDWKSIDFLHQKVTDYVVKNTADQTSYIVDRIDVRKEKGIAKFIFTNRYEVQIDGATGKILNFQKRHSDVIENIHDGSIIDIYFNLNGTPVKLIYTTVMSLALFIFTVTGFWLWYGPKRMRAQRS